MAGLGDAFRSVGGMTGWEHCMDSTGAMSGHAPTLQEEDLKPTWPVTSAQGLALHS